MDKKKILNIIVIILLVAIIAVLAIWVGSIYQPNFENRVMQVDVETEENLDLMINSNNPNAEIIEIVPDASNEIVEENDLPLHESNGSDQVQSNADNEEEAEVETNQLDTREAPDSVRDEVTGVRPPVGERPDIVQ